MKTIREKKLDHLTEVGGTSRIKQELLARRRDYSVMRLCESEKPCLRKALRA
jgi:hypothetical protein